MTVPKNSETLAVDVDRLSDDAARLEAELLCRVIGQPRAVRAFVRAYEVFVAGLQAPHRPLGCFLFLGPTGVGKTRLCSALCEALFGNAKMLVRVDCAEFQKSHEVAKLIGSPPGYVGHRESKPRLTRESLYGHLDASTASQLGVVLFDEIEKASEAVRELLLGVFDNGIMTAGDGTETDFSRAFIIMTSNLGSTDLQKILHGQKIGFHDHETAKADIDTDLYHSAMAAVRKEFAPEFIGRIDKTICFHPLSQESLRAILNIELQAVQDRVLRKCPIILQVTDAAKDFLLAESDHVTAEGARHIKKTVERFLTTKLASILATRQAVDGDVIVADKLKLKKKTKELSFAVVRTSPDSVDLEAQAADENASQ